MSNCYRILLMGLSDLSGDPRPNRLCHLLSTNSFYLDVLGYEPKSKLPVANYYTFSPPASGLIGKLYRISALLLQTFFLAFGNSASPAILFCNSARYSLLNLSNIFKNISYDWIIVEDLQLLPLAFRIRGKSKILFDAREFYTRQNESSLRFRLFEYYFRDFLLKKFAVHCDKSITVSDGLLCEYKKVYSIDMSVVLSTPPYHNISVRNACETIKLVHHGVANKNRGIHNMIEIVRRLDERFTLDLYLVGSKSSVESLVTASMGCPRIRFHSPVPYHSIITMLSGYDIGFFYCEPVTFNLYHSLPNKFFEYIQARLALAIGPSPDMSSYVFKYQCGFVALEFQLDSMIDTLSMLTLEDINNAKKNSDLAAKDLCYEIESKKLLSTLYELI